MGNWHISIKGCGIHHNGRKDDAEQMAADFVDQLKASGQTITSADVTVGSVVNVEDRGAGLLAVAKTEDTKPE